MEGIAEVFHAHIVDWGYPSHSHDTWTVLIVDHGAIDYSLDRRPCAAAEDTVAILPPGVVHDGRPLFESRRNTLSCEPDDLGTGYGPIKWRYWEDTTTVDR